jgi:hypothetical protein
VAGGRPIEDEDDDEYENERLYRYFKLTNRYAVSDRQFSGIA